jgi:hypothetical protein
MWHAVLLGLALASAATAPAPGDTAREILKRDKYQTELPLQPATPPTVRDTWARSEPVDVPLPPPVPIPDGFLSGASYLVIGIVLAIGVAWLIKNVAPSTSLEDGAATPTEARTPRPRAIPAGDPESRARAGRFAEAIHALLLAALRELSRRAGSLAATPASTSREVLRSAALDREVKEALAPLVTTVERVHFGRGTAGPEDYASCAAHYRRIREACRAAR